MLTGGLIPTYSYYVCIWKLDEVISHQDHSTRAQLRIIQRLSVRTVRTVRTVRSILGSSELSQFHTCFQLQAAEKRANMAAVF